MNMEVRLNNEYALSSKNQVVRLERFPTVHLDRAHVIVNFVSVRRQPEGDFARQHNKIITQLGLWTPTARQQAIGSCSC